MLNGMLSHTCGRWYLPMFLLKDELLIFMDIDSFMVLARLTLFSDVIYLYLNVTGWSGCRIHWRNLKNIGGEVQRTPQGPLPNI